MRHFGNSNADSNGFVELGYSIVMPARKLIVEVEANDCKIKMTNIILGLFW